MPIETHISSLIVHIQPKALMRVRGVLEHLTGCEVAAADSGGKLVLVLETSDSSQITETIDRIKELAGVINVMLAYHHCEDESSLNEEVDYENNAT